MQYIYKYQEKNNYTFDMNNTKIKCKSIDYKDIYHNTTGNFFGACIKWDTLTGMLATEHFIINYSTFYIISFNTLYSSNSL